MYKMTKPKAKPKARHFTFLIYPDSAPENWQKMLQEIDLPIAISPLHDKDQREIEDPFALAEEEIELYNKGMLFKKPHYHCIIVYTGPVTADAVRNRIRRALDDEEKKEAVNKVQIIKKGIHSMYQYLTHESVTAIEEGKYKYDKADIVHLNNFDIDRYIVLDAHDKEDMLDTILGVIDANGLENHKQLSRYMAEHGEEHGIDSRKQLTAIIKANIGMIRLAFDGEFQERKRAEEKEEAKRRAETESKWRKEK